MSNRTGQLVAAVAIAMLALPAAAGSWPNISPRKAPAKASQAAAPAVATPRPIDGFEYIGGEGSWQPRQHKYVRSAEGFVHSDDCDHAIRTAEASTYGKAAGAPSASGFEYIGGEGSWQPSQHKYVGTAGGFVHSEECDHAIRTAKAPTAAELEWNVRLYGGA